MLTKCIKKYKIKVDSKEKMEEIFIMKNMQSKKNKKIDNKHGVTLIALVVTMVAIFILAGVSIRLVTEDNGLIKKATDVRNQVEKEAENEEKEREELTNQIYNK